MHHRSGVNGVAATGAWLALALTWLIISAAAWSLPATPDRRSEASDHVLRAMELHLAAGRLEAALALAAQLDEGRLEGGAFAALQRMKGHAYTRQGAYDRALSAYQQILSARRPIAAATIMQTRYAAAQLCFALERFHDAVDHLHAWQALGGTRSDDYRPLVLLGQAYFKLREPRRAARTLELAISRARAAGVDVPEHWQQLLRHVRGEAEAR